MESGPWVPLLTGAEHRAAESALFEVADALRDIPLQDPAIATGTAGLALLFAYLAQAHGRPEDEQTATALLDRSVHAMIDTTMVYGLHSGFCGVGWVVEHLVGPEDDDDPLVRIDEAVARTLEHEPWTDHYDLIAGLVGLGIYASERLPRPSALRSCERIVQLLRARAEEREPGTTWFTPSTLLPPLQRAVAPDGYFNLGLAHGVPGVIAGLSQLAYLTDDPSVRTMVAPAVDWLLAQQVQGATPSTFPGWVSPTGRCPPPRLAWCYGDPGVAAALLGTARAWDEPKWERAAVQIALDTLEVAIPDSGIMDAGLCHGASGLGHIYNRLHQATRDERFADAARRWLKQALALRRPGQGFAGFCAFEPGEDGPGRWLDLPGLLMGAAGVGLALLAATTDIAPDWDRVLLLDVPPAP